MRSAQGRHGTGTVATTGGRRVGIVGATTPRLRSVSSPRDVVVLQGAAGVYVVRVAASGAGGTLAATGRLTVAR